MERGQPSKRGRKKKETEPLPPVAIEEKEKRVTKRPRPITPTETPRSENRHVLWTDEHLSRLISVLKTHGFDGDYQAIQQHLHPFSDNTLKSIFNQLVRWSDGNKDESLDKKTGGKKGPVTPAPIEEWISMIRDSIEVQRLASNASLMMEWIAKFEEHPDPADCCGVDYKAIYVYISSLMKGHIPKQLDAPSASKLYMMFLQLVNTIAQSAQASQELLVKTAKLPSANAPIARDEKNRLLRERRRAVWTEKELEMARTIKSDDPEEIKKIYCDKPGLNPFSFPPSI